MSTTIVVVALLLGVILVGVVLVRRQQTRKMAALELEQQKAAEERSKKDLLRKQKDLGLILWDALNEASKQNTVFNVLDDGRIASSLGPIEVEDIKNNGGKYTVIVSLPDPTCSTMGGLRKKGFPLFQVDVDLKDTGCEIYVLKGPYGPYRHYSVEEFGVVATKLCKYTSGYRHFGECPDQEVFEFAVVETQS